MRFYFAQCKQAWSGDRFGNEWKLGWSVYAADMSDTATSREFGELKPYVVYEDDGRGNGSFAGHFDTLPAARNFVDRQAWLNDNALLPADEARRRAAEDGLFVRVLVDSGVDEYAVSGQARSAWRYAELYLATMPAGRMG